MSNFPDKKTLSVAEAAKILGVGRGSVYNSIRTGELPSLKLGTRILIPTSKLRLIVDGNAIDQPIVEKETSEMPPRSKRTSTVEADTVANIIRYRKGLGLTYEDMAERMRAVGCEIHFSGVQKTEKSGRRITVEELAAYALVFGVGPDTLMGLPNSEPETASLKARIRLLQLSEEIRNLASIG